MNSKKSAVIREKIQPLSTGTEFIEGRCGHDHSLSVGGVDRCSVCYKVGYSEGRKAGLAAARDMLAAAAGDGY